MKVMEGSGNLFGLILNLGFGLEHYLRNATVFTMTTISLHGIFTASREKGNST